MALIRPFKPRDECNDSRGYYPRKSLRSSRGLETINVYGISEMRLFFATWNRTESAPTITHGVACRDTTAPYIVCAPVRRPLPRMCTMLGGRFGSDLPPIAM